MRYVIAFFVAITILAVYTYAYAEDVKTWEYSLHPTVYCEQRIQFKYEEWPRAKIVTVCFTTYPEYTQEKKETANVRRRRHHH